MIRKVTADPAKEIISFLDRWETYFEMCGTKEGVYIKLKDNFTDFFNIHKTIKLPQNSDKFVKLYLMLKKYKWASNENLSNLLSYKQSQSTSRFLSGIKWVERIGNGTALKYKLTQEYD